MSDTSAERYWTWRHQQALELEALEAEVAQLRQIVAGSVPVQRLHQARDEVARLRQALTRAEQLAERWDKDVRAVTNGSWSTGHQPQSCFAEELRAALAAGDTTP